MLRLSLALRLSALLALLAPVAASCGGKTSEEDLPAGAAGAAGSLAGHAGTAGKAGKAGHAGTAGKPVADAGTDAPDDTLPDYTDPGCPDAGPPITDYDCDPYTPGTCGFQMSCYPFVKYPSEPCGQEIFGAKCVSSGSSGQGEPCDGGCKDQHICVVSGQGTQCVRLCSLDEPKGCDGGLVCQPIDIPGFGGCI